MIVSCPACEVRYLIDDKELRGSAGRIVRCANCGHTWHQSASSEARFEPDAAEPEGRIEPALEVPPRPGAAAVPTLSIPPRPKPISEPPIAQRRSRWAAVRWLVLVVLFALAILAGVVVARGAVVANPILRAAASCDTTQAIAYERRDFQVQETTNVHCNESLQSCSDFAGGVRACLDGA